VSSSCNIAQVSNYNSPIIVHIEFSSSFVFFCFCFEESGQFVSKAECGEMLNVGAPENGGALPTGNPMFACVS